MLISISQANVFSALALGGQNNVNYIKKKKKKKKGEYTVYINFYFCLFHKGFRGTSENKSINTWRHKFLVNSQKEMNRFDTASSKWEALLYSCPKKSGSKESGRKGKGRKRMEVASEETAQYLH